MFKKIVLALDGSDGAKKAIPVAAELAEREKAEIVIAHVVEYMMGRTSVPQRADADEIRAEVEREAEELNGRGIKTKVYVLDHVLGGPAHAIVEIADRTDGDLIVVGTRGHSAAVGVVLGSVVQRLLHVAKQPILVVPA